MSKASDDEQVQRAVEQRMRELEELYGRVPLVPQVLSERPDIFLPYTTLADAAMQRTKHLDRRTAELAAIAAGSALASAHCLNVHIDAAFREGAKHDEVLEAMQIGAFMAMTRSESVALRALQEAEGRAANNGKS
ncbi:MAG: carboxymuconolactone decarboxylase family protein [Methanomassiliicoccales archaeon]|jgi:AhpD family alkylhydroperoxidase|nr:carboxymuconolactone decarboxylase family protein [Methanomassiliicoccales archaeon]